MAKPKQIRLPGTEDAKIEDLHGAAEKYADLRDKRMAVLKNEVDAKAGLLSLMKKHRKTNYVYDGLEISIIPGEEKLRVRVQHGGEDESEEES